MFVDSHRSASRPASPDRRDCFALRSHGGARTAPGRVGHAVQAQAQAQALVSALALALMLLFAAEQVRAQPVAAAADIQTVVRTGDIESLRQAVAAGADLNARDHWGRTPLLVASQLKNTAAVRLLLARGADVDLANKNDITPLIAAAQTGNLEAMSLLLGADAARDRSDNLGWTALMWAANRNDGSAHREAHLRLVQSSAELAWSSAVAGTCSRWWCLKRNCRGKRIAPARPTCSAPDGSSDAEGRATGIGVS